MHHREKKGIINEVEYKMMRLKEIIPKLERKRIVIYGVGVNAKRALDCMRSLNVLGLMDKEYTGKFFYGKKVLSQEEVLLMDVDTLLIAATPEATEIVYERVMLFCMKNHIAILDMYGCDEFVLHKKILEQELEYPGLKKEWLKGYINSNRVVVFSFKEVLCSEIVSDERYFFEKMEKCLEKEGCFYHNFAKKRMQAGKRACNRTGTNRKVIYELLSTMIDAEKKQIEYIKELEQKQFLENLVPRVQVIELLKYAIEQEKEVYIYLDVLNEDIMNTFLESYGISKYKKIFADPEMLQTRFGTTIRTLGEQYGYDKVLYLGANTSSDLLIPQLYNINFQLIQSSLNTFIKNTRLEINQNSIEFLSDRDEIIKDILEIYSTPFLNEIDSMSCDNIIAEKIGWQGEEGNINVECLPVRQFETTDTVDKISFPKNESPQVTIIVSLHNNVEYTYNCLKSILLNTDTISYEVIVVDHGWNDYSLRIEEYVSGITVIHGDKKRKNVKNYNDAVKVAKGIYVVFLDNNTQVQVNWLYSLVKCIKMKKTGIVGAKLVSQDGRLREAGRIIWNNGTICKYGEHKKPDAPEYGYVREVDAVSGTIMLIKKELWNDIGGFDEIYTNACYLVADLACKVREKKEKVIYQPDSIVVQFEDETDHKDIGLRDDLDNDRDYFIKKWNIVEKQNREKRNKKTVLFISGIVPAYDRDAGSRTIDFYIREFLDRDYIVKFLPTNFVRSEPYTYRLEQMGVEVLGGEYYKRMITNWICSHYGEIDFVFLNYPDAAIKFIDIFKSFGISVMYYGVDLHYVRLQREYELFGNKEKAEQAKLYYEKEAYLIQNSDAVYYPSLVETEIVEKEFKRNDAKQLLINVYDTDKIRGTYKPAERAGLMFLGSYGHAPNVDAIHWFSDCIFPQVYSRLKIPFYIAGSNMPKDLIQSDREGIKVLGTLTDSELEEMYNSVKMIVVPLRYGAGIKGKVIEAMYHGIPTVTTPIGIEGIPNEGDAVKVADSEEEFAEAVIALYQSEEQLAKMSVLGQNIIRKHYSREAAWRNIAEDFS